MTKIAIAVAKPTESKEAVIFLHKRLGMALSSAQKAMKLGERQLFYTTELFLNDHVEKDKDIMDILNWFRDHNISLAVYMLDEDMDWYDVKNLSDVREPEEYLRNVLDGSRGEFR